MEPLVKPPYSFVGSKTGKSYKFTLEHLRPLLSDRSRLIEPFCGSGRVFFGTGLTRGWLNDLQVRHINFFNDVRECSDVVVRMFNFLKKSYREGTKERYIDIRNEEPFTPGFRSAWFLFVLLAGFNKLLRVNKKNIFNTPWGGEVGLKRVNRYNTDDILKLSEFLNENPEIQFTNMDAFEVLNNVSEGDVVYLDPPYKGTFRGFTEVPFDMDRYTDLHKKVVEIKANINDVKIMMHIGYDKDLIDVYESDAEIHILDTIRKVRGRGSEVNVKEMVIVL